MQLQNEKAFECGRAAFDALAEDVTWSRVTARRHASVGLLGTFIERRQAIWVEAEALQKERADMPKLAPLSGIRSSVYGVRFCPRLANTVHLSRFLCFCRGCSSWPRGQCAFPHLSTSRAHTLRIKGEKEVTKVQLNGFLLLQQPPVSLAKSARRDVYIRKAAEYVVWADQERQDAEGDAAALSQAVSVKVLAFLAERASRLQQEDAERLEAAHALVLQGLRAALQRADSGPGPSEDVVLQSEEGKSEDVQEGGDVIMSPSLSRARLPPEGQPSAAKRVRLDPQAQLDALRVGDKVAVLYEDSGWCHGTVLSVARCSFVVKWLISSDSTRFTFKTFIKDLEANEAQIGEWMDGE